MAGSPTNFFKQELIGKNSNGNDFFSPKSDALGLKTALGLKSCGENETDAFDEYNSLSSGNYGLGSKNNYFTEYGKSNFGVPPQNFDSNPDAAKKSGFKINLAEFNKQIASQNNFQSTNPTTNPREKDTNDFWSNPRSNENKLFTDFGETYNLELKNKKVTPNEHAIVTHKNFPPPPQSPQGLFPSQPYHTGDRDNWLTKCSDNNYISKFNTNPRPQSQPAEVPRQKPSFDLGSGFDLDQIDGIDGNNEDLSRTFERELEQGILTDFIQSCAKGDQGGLGGSESPDG